MIRHAPPCGRRSYLQGGLSFTRAGLPPVSLSGRSFVPAGLLAPGSAFPAGCRGAENAPFMEPVTLIIGPRPEPCQGKNAPFRRWGAIYIFCKHPVIQGKQGHRASPLLEVCHPGAGHARSSRLPSPAAGLTDCRRSSGTPGSRGTDREGTPSGSTASIRSPTHPLAVCTSPAGRVMRAPFRKAWRGSLGIPLLVGRLPLCCIFTAVVSPSGG